MKLENNGRFIFAAICLVIGLFSVSTPVSAQINIGPGGVQQFTTSTQAQLQLQSRQILTGPAIWRIGSTAADHQMNSTVPMMPMVMPQQTYGSGIGLHSHYPVNNTLIIIGDQNYGYGSLAPMDYYPSVFGLYDGLPQFIYAPSYWITTDSSGNWVFEDLGSYYPYIFDPFEQSSLSVNPDGQLGSSLTNALNSFATDWSSGDSTGLTNYVPQTSTVSMGVGNQYEYNVPGSVYLQMANNALHGITTNDFHYTGVRVKDNGDVLATAVQSYRGANNAVYGQSSIKIALSKDQSLLKGYRITGFSVQKVK